MSIGEACAAAVEIGAPAAYLTHAVDFTEWSQRVPAGVSLAYDGLRLRLE